MSRHAGNRGPAVPEGIPLALAGGLAAWAAGCSWIPMFAAPEKFLVPGAIGALLIVIVGWLARLRGTPAIVIVAAQLVISYALTALWFSPARGGRGVRDLGALPDALVHGARQINTYASPAPERFGDVAIFLCICLMLLTLGIDLVAGTLRRAPVAGLLLLLAVTVPISVLSERLSPWVFVLTGAAFLGLLALAHGRDVHAWGRRVAAVSPVRRSPASPGAVIGAGCLAAAVLMSGVLPVSHGIFNHHSDSGAGNGTRGITLANPLIDLRRDLVQMSHTPLVTVRTNDPDPSYVQLSVLDDFTGNQWRASERKLPESNKLPAILPPASGLSPSQAGRNTRWTMTLAPTFTTSWLPVPTPTSEVDVTGDWRFDARTLDIVDTAEHPPGGALTYHVRAFHPRYDANALNESGTPVGEAIDGMTKLPHDMPSVISSTARRITRGERTEYQKLAAMQRWFRSTGGFRYSTEPAPGSGMDLLAAFITRDKVGYCEQFAAAMAVMARSLGIPSRVVVGFLRPTGKAPKAGTVEFTSDDLHAWPQFYFSGSGWVTFDPTPGARTGGAPAYTEQALNKQRVRPSRSASPRPKQPARTRTPDVVQHKSATHKHTGGHGAWWLLLIPALALVAGTPRMLRSRQRRRRLGVPQAAGPAGVASGAWAEIRATARDLEMDWEDGRSPRQAFAVLRLRAVNDPDLADDLDWLRRFIERAWYAPAGLVDADDPDDPDDTERIRRIVLRWRSAMRALVTERAARRERWLPRSLFERRAPLLSDPFRDVAVVERDRTRT